MELRLNCCWRFDPLVIHSHRNEIERKIKREKNVLFPREAEGTSCCPERKKKTEYLRWNLGSFFVGD
jgi:hypothetical protein